MFYEYACDECKEIEVKEHGMTENPSYKCSHCGKKMRKVISGGAGIHYKGNGWPRKGSGLMGNPTRTTEVGVKVNPAMKDAVSDDIKRSQK